MDIDYELWVKKHNLCVESINELYGLDSEWDFVKCNSTLCVMKNAMLDIQGFFKRDVKTPAELCFLIRNIDVIVSGILGINKILLGIGLNKQDKAIDKCFTDGNTIKEFRTLRSLILAHPVDTKFNDKNGKQETIYLEDIIPSGRIIYKEKYDYLIKICSPESCSSSMKPILFEKDIVPVINTIIDSLDKLMLEIKDRIESLKNKVLNEKLCVKHDTDVDWIRTLNQELEKRYPFAVEHDGYEEYGYSVVLQCLIYFQTKFKHETQKKYELFLNYIRKELKQIEDDLQSMKFDEDSYFSLLDDSRFAKDLSYEKQKMEYLLHSNKTSYTEDVIEDSTESDALYGIKCFRKLQDYISEYIPLDVSVSDKELYCQYIAAVFLSNIDA